MFVLLVGLLGSLLLSAANGGAAPAECVQRGLLKHKGDIPWESVMSTDPSQPFDTRMFNFEFFSHKTPHMVVPSLAETDRIHSELCSERNSFESIMLGDGDVLAASTNPLEGLFGDDEELLLSEPVKCKSFPDRVCTKGKASCGARGYDANQCPGDTYCCKPEGAADGTSTDGSGPVTCKNDPSRVCTQGKASCGTRGYDAGQCPGDTYCCKHERRAAHGGQAAGPDGGGGLVRMDNSLGTPATLPNTPAGSPFIPVQSTTMSGGITGIKIPIPEVPKVFIGIDIRVDVTAKPDARTFGGREVIKLGIDFEVGNVYIFVALEGSATGLPVIRNQRKISATFASTFYTTALFAAYSQAGAIKTNVETVVNGLTAGLDSAGTPTYPSKILELYTEGFSKWYLQVYEDEWTYVTEVTGDQWKNKPSDAVILDAIKRIEKMMEITPGQLPDGSLVWEYTASSTWTSTKLKYKMNKDKSWTWSPDGENWMKMSEITVKGGRWNGEKPTDDNIKTIQAIKLIYEDNPGLIASPGSALQVDAEVGCDCTNNPNQFGCGTYCSAINAAKSGYNYAADKVSAGYNYAADKAKEGYEAAKTAVVNTYEAGRQVVNDAVDKTVEVYNKAKDFVVGVIDNAGKALAAAAKRTVEGFKAFYTRFKEAIKQTGVYRILQRSLFKNNAPRKPSRVFSNLAEAMREEGFQNTDALAERALFVVDSALSRDFTRVLSLRESIMAFCLKNKSQADKIKARFNDILGHRKHFGNGNNPYGQGELQQGFQPSTKNVRMEEVTKQLNEKDGGAKTEVEAAKELYMQIANELTSRYDHIRTIALAQAERLKKLGDPTWGSLSFERQNEYRKAFFDLRGTIGELHTMLKEINAGDGWLKRGVLSGLSFIKQKTATYMDAISSKTKAMMIKDGCGLSTTLGLELGVGLYLGTPKAPGFGASVSIEVAGMLGWSAGVDPATKQSFEDRTKTYSGTFVGVKGTIVGGIKSTNAAMTSSQGLLSVVGSIAFVAPSDTLCTFRYPTSVPRGCKEVNAVLVVSFPTGFGLTPQQLSPVFALALGANLGQTEAQTNRTADLFKGLLGHIVPGSGGSAPKIEPGDFAREFVTILTDYGLPMLVTSGAIPGAMTLRLTIVTNYFVGMKNGKKIGGFKSVILTPSLSIEMVPPEVKEATKSLLMGGEISFTMGTGFSFDLTKIFPALAQERELPTIDISKVDVRQAALEVDDDGARADRSICEPERLSARVGELRDALLRYASKSAHVRNDIINTLSDLERLCSKP